MKSIFEKIAISVAFVLAGTVLIIIGAIKVFPFGNPQTSVPSPMDLVLFFIGLILLVWSGVIAWKELSISREILGVPSSPNNFVNEITEGISLKMGVRFDELKFIVGRMPTYTPSLFEDRITHFDTEKKFLADQFTPYLLRRCKYHIENGKQVHLIIDSGTTLFGFFERLGKAAVRAKETKGEWINELYLETNNLRGVEMLMLVGRLIPSSRYSPLAINCNLLPGVPIPIYSAVTGKRTNNALQNIRDEKGNDAIFIALTTGNWIRLRRSAPACPIPLARGQGHLEFKQALIDNSDEVFVVTPLGKVFVDTPPGDVNVALEFDENNPDPEKKPYHEVQISDEKAKSIKMISTSRKPHYVLSHQSTTVNTVLGLHNGDLDKVLSEFHKIPISELGHISFPFDMLPDEWQTQIETEFPHHNTRNEKFMQKFFHVPSHQ